jgi:hypothetical protein
MARFNPDLQSATQFNVVPRIKILQEHAQRGDLVGVSLRGFAARTVVQIRWWNGTKWIEAGRTTTSGTGSATVQVTVPMWAPEGRNAIRGDALTAGGGSAQTNAFSAESGIEAATDTPTATPTAKPESVASSETVEPTASAPPNTPTATPTTTPSPTLEATEVPTDTPTPTSVPASSTPTPVSPTATPSETPTASS